MTFVPGKTDKSDPQGCKALAVACHRREVMLSHCTALLPQSFMLCTTSHHRCIVSTVYGFCWRKVEAHAESGLSEQRYLRHEVPVSSTSFIKSCTPQQQYLGTSAVMVVLTMVPSA